MEEFPREYRREMLDGLELVAARRHERLASDVFVVNAGAGKSHSQRDAWPSVAREGRFGYLLAESTGISEPLPVAEPRLGRRTVLTFPLLPPPQKN